MSESVFDLLAVFLVLIAPLWLILHYIVRWRTAKRGFSSEDLERIETLQRDSKHMRERIETLENILDAKVPDWRRSR